MDSTTSVIIDDIIRNGNCAVSRDSTRCVIAYYIVGNGGRGPCGRDSITIVIAYGIVRDDGFATMYKDSTTVVIDDCAIFNLKRTGEAPGINPC